MKLRQLVESDKALGNLIQQPVASGLAYRLAMLVKQMQPYMEQFYKQRMEIAKKFGKEIGGRVEVPNEKLVEFATEIEPLLNEDVVISFKSIDPEALGVNIAAADMLALDWLFAEAGEAMSK